MKMYQFQAGMTIWADSEDEAYDECEAFARMTNKSGDGPRLWIEVGAPEIVDEDDS